MFDALQENDVGFKDVSVACSIFVPVVQINLASYDLRYVIRMDCLRIICKLGLTSSCSVVRLHTDRSRHPYLDAATRFFARSLKFATVPPSE